MFLKFCHGLVGVVSSRRKGMLKRRKHCGSQRFLQNRLRFNCVSLYYFSQMIDFRQDLLLISQCEFSQDNVGQGDSEDEEESHGTARKGSYSL